VRLSTVSAVLLTLCVLASCASDSDGTGAGFHVPIVGCVGPASGTAPSNARAQRAGGPSPNRRTDRQLRPLTGPCPNRQRDRRSELRHVA